MSVFIQTNDGPTLSLKDIFETKKSLSFVGLIILAMQHIMNKYISRDSVKYRTLRWACNLLLILYFCCFSGR